MIVISSQTNLTFKVQRRTKVEGIFPWELIRETLKRGRKLGLKSKNEQRPVEEH